MNKFVEFYQKAMADASAKGEMEKILGGTDISKATDDQLKKVEAVAAKLGFKITAAEAKQYLQGTSEVTDDDLEAVAGGKGDTTCTSGGSTTCKYAGGQIDPSVSC